MGLDKTGLIIWMYNSIQTTWAREQVEDLTQDQKRKYRDDCIGGCIQCAVLNGYTKQQGCDALSDALDLWMEKHIERLQWEVPIHE